MSRVCYNCKIHLLIKPINRIIKYIKERSKKSCIQVQPVIIISSHRLLHILVPENVSFSQVHLYNSFHDPPQRINDDAEVVSDGCFVLAACDTCEFLKWLSRIESKNG